MAAFESCFTAPTFRTFCGLVAGLVAQTGSRTVCGMLVGAGLSRVWAHDRAHRFFSAARWSPQRVGLELARLMVSLLVPVGAAVGRRVWAVSWFHDGSATGKDKVGFGNNWVIAGIIVALPCVSRPVCLPVLAALVVKDTTSASRLWLARGMAQALTSALPDRQIHVVADAAYTPVANCAAGPTESAGLHGYARMLWYATAGHHPDDITAYRDRVPWYTTKSQPSAADMLAKLRRRLLIAARFHPSHPDTPTPAEIHTIRLAWDTHPHNRESRVSSRPAPR